MKVPLDSLLTLVAPFYRNLINMLQSDILAVLPNCLIRIKSCFIDRQNLYLESGPKQQPRTSFFLSQSAYSHCKFASELGFYFLKLLYVGVTVS